MPVKQICRTLSPYVAASLMLTGCSGPRPEAQEDMNGVVTEAANVANAAQTTPDHEAKLDNESEPATNASEPDAPAAPAAAQAQPPVAPKLPTPAPTPVVRIEQPAQFATCLTCHSVERDAPGKLGPNLFGVVGSKAGSKADYAYSEAMKASGILWSPVELSAFLLAPQTRVPGTKMTMKGPSDEKIRQAMIDYLATLK
ncbi:MAG TPA: c-type cytochrome [Sphingobium sp.]|nr:c-type cytochrome [Sphingobium sp.]